MSMAMTVTICYSVGDVIGAGGDTLRWGNTTVRRRARAECRAQTAVRAGRSLVPLADCRLAYVRTCSMPRIEGGTR